MTISSRTPEGEPNRCPVCGAVVAVEPSDPAGDAPCPRCGVLLWFPGTDDPDAPVVARFGALVNADAIDRISDLIGEEPGRSIVLDLSATTYITSAALARMINLKKRLFARRGRLLIRNLHPDLAEVFRITRLDQVFERA